MQAWTPHKESYFDNIVSASVNICCIGVHPKQAWANAVMGLQLDMVNT